MANRPTKGFMSVGASSFAMPHGAGGGDLCFMVCCNLCPPLLGRSLGVFHAGARSRWTIRSFAVTMVDQWRNIIDLSRTEIAQRRAPRCLADERVGGAKPRSLTLRNRIVFCSDLFPSEVDDRAAWRSRCALHRSGPRKHLSASVCAIETDTHTRSGTPPRQLTTKTHRILPPCSPQTLPRRCSDFQSLTGGFTDAARSERGGSTGHRGDPLLARIGHPAVHQVWPSVGSKVPARLRLG
jgi:hypothetical protein